MTPAQRDMLLGPVAEDDDSSTVDDLLAIMVLLLWAALLGILERIERYYPEVTDDE